jgi:NADH-ubiquinone oxidoreductase chain 2
MLILSNSVTLRRDKSILFNRSVIISLLYSSLLVFNSYYLLFLNNGIGLYGGLFFISSITHTFHIIIYILTGIILLFTGFYPSFSFNNKNDSAVYTETTNSVYNIEHENNLEYEEENAKEQNKDYILSFKSEMYKIIEYPLIILFIINGALFLVCTSDLISIFISIELQSYGLYLLSTIYKDSELATSGGLMYFLLGGLSSCFILLGTALLYANSGTTNIDNLYIINDISNICSESNTIYNSYYIIISLIFMTVGFLFKVSAAPFHF